MSLISPTRAPVWDRARVHIETDLERPLAESLGHIVATLDWLAAHKLLSLWGLFQREATTYRSDVDFWFDFSLNGSMVEPEAYEFLSLYYPRWIETVADGGGYRADVSAKPWSDFWAEYLDKKSGQWRTALAARDPRPGARWLGRIATDDHDRDDILLLAWTGDSSLANPLRALTPQLGGCEPQTTMTSNGTRRSATDGMAADVAATYLESGFAGLSRRVAAPDDDALTRILMPSALRYVRDAAPDALATLDGLWQWARTARVLQQNETQRRHYFGGLLELVDSLAEPNGRLVLDAPPDIIGVWSARLNEFFGSVQQLGERAVAILAARRIGDSTTLALLDRAEAQEPVRTSPALQDRVAEARAAIAERQRLHTG